MWERELRKQLLELVCNRPDGKMDLIHLKPKAQMALVKRTSED